jgi:hypothetical protein
MYYVPSCDEYHTAHKCLVSVNLSFFKGAGTLNFLAIKDLKLLQFTYTRVLK